MVKLRTLQKIEKVTRRLAFATLGVLPFVRFPKLALGAGLAARRFLPVIGRRAILPIAKRITLKRLAVGTFVAGAALQSPTILGAIKKAPTAPFRLGGRIGREFETRVEKEVRKEPKGAVQKALEIGGITGIVGAGALIGAKALKRRKVREVFKAEVPTPLLAAPLAAPALPVRAEVVPATITPAIATPGAVTEKPKKRKKISTPRERGLSPVFINQIQISN